VSSDKLQPGIYEEVVNAKIARQLSDIPENCKETEKIDKAEASRVLSAYLQKFLQRELDQAAEKGGIEEQVQLTNRIVSMVENTGCAQEESAGSEQVAPEACQLMALMSEEDPRLAVGRTVKDMSRPETSIARSSLFTGSEHEPQLYSELKKEILSCSRIDFLVSFIRWTGLRLIMDELREFTNNGGHLRVIATTYLGATDFKAIKELASLPNTEIRISYDTKRTRLHAKSYIFYRDTGYSTAYIGSSNLSRPAISSGLEWNVKITASDQPDTMRKVGVTFESYWNADEFEPFHQNSQKDEERLSAALSIEKNGGMYRNDGKSGLAYSNVFTIRPYPFQQQILDALKAEREIRHEHRNLIVAATGTGKTVIAAFDYRRYCREHPGQPCRLLFVAHREEILKQALVTFRGILQDQNFGEMYVGRYHPENADYLFVSIQTLNSQELCGKLPADYYDFIIVDEFHHAAAPAYQQLLSYFRPKILLGLTATPERMDGRSILDYFDGRIAAEIRLPEAIDRKLLCPFQYFGVTDTVDLQNLRWTRGGYEKSELENVYVYKREIALRRAAQIVRSVYQYVTDMNDVRGLGFCVSVEHARFMADYFNGCGIPSIALSGESEPAVRETAGKRLAVGEIRFIFVVDIYNEGVDIPEVNTILFLRPTESLTIFLQQLGRGLRLAEGKDCLTVLDFIGQANRKYNFEQKFSALLDHAGHSVRQEIQNGFVDLPRGCYIRLEKKAQSYILDNIRHSYSSRTGLVARIASFEEDSGQKLSLAEFLNYYRITPRAIYSKKTSFSRLCVLAGKQQEFHEPAEEILTKAFLRFSDIDSRRWIVFLQKRLPSILQFYAEGDIQSVGMLSGNEKRMLQMFYITVFGSSISSWYVQETVENFRMLSESPVMMAEFMDLLAYQYSQIDLVDIPADLGFDCPLDVHCTYTRDQLLAALDYMTPSNIREGVKWLPDKKSDILMVTLNKSEKEYSPSTMYNDYSINENMFHWQSQSTTTETSPTGQRYIHHEQMGTHVLLFVRESKNAEGGAAPYTYLGPVSYMSHNGSRPMNIVWKLKSPIPAKYIRRTSQMEAG
jgi:superfamily II DNA or RNA helicase/HKD family nuclease